MTMVLKKGKYLTILGKLIKPIWKKNDQSECVNYRGIYLVSIGCKLLSMIVLLDFDIL